MNRNKMILETTEIEINGIKTKYEVECYDGYGIGKLIDEVNTSAPNAIKLVYPKLNELSLFDKFDCLTQLGLEEYAPVDLHQGDIMKVYGKLE